MTQQQIADRILEAFPEAQVDVRDLTGGRDHWEVHIVSEAFAGKMPIQRHRMIYDLFAEELKGPIHALTLKTLTPAQAEEHPREN